MDIKKMIIAGTEEKSDALVTINKGNGRSFVIEKLPHLRFEKHVISILNKVLDEEDIQNVSIVLQDFGALDFVIEARLRAAIHEAIKEDE